MKKIVVLNGSGRVGGNTSALIDAFCKGAEEAGHEVVRFDLGKMTIHPCMGCFGGGKDAASPAMKSSKRLTHWAKVYKVHKNSHRLQVRWLFSLGTFKKCHCFFEGFCGEHARKNSEPKGRELQDFFFHR